MATIEHVILDRDGTLNAEAPGGYVRTPAQWRWLPGVLRALARFRAAGLRVSVATNQSCVGRGIISAADLDQIHQRMLAEATAPDGAVIDAIFVCPHAPDHGCRCRKPGPGLIEQAVAASGIATAATLLVGDAGRDLQAAQATGVQAWLVRSGKGRATEGELDRGALPKIDVSTVRVFDDLQAAADAMLGATP
jgi:D-glycero-D-manno-heptose 1,7-bisphosphate phosphatase